MLRKRVDDDGLSGHWDDDLPGCILAYNASKHSVTGNYSYMYNYTHILIGNAIIYRTFFYLAGVSPYRAVFGSEPLLPCDSTATTSLTASDRCTELTQQQMTDLLKQRDARRAEVFNLMSARIKSAQQKMIRYHQMRNASSGSQLKLGDHVLLRNKKRDDRKGGKMESTWSSDVYEIVDVRGRSTFKLKNLSSNIYLQKVVNGIHLKKYYYA